jgi:hypothetical protein
MALRESASPEPPLSAACDSIAHRIDLMSGLVAAHVLRAVGDDIDGVLVKWLVGANDGQNVSLD